ncbi:hypothetical protein SFB4_257G0, partial [Candidatus Arthromitus sp. SFB-4]
VIEEKIGVKVSKAQDDQELQKITNESQNVENIQ